ncbi:MAG: hypothetical protein BWX50_01349 [Euryarchaeota archaeon ADurb.Bin009]|nr:MAG: hypothetical protein BWX50_01349 [Euryarchaeota archaeon ADurb.Bin009]
MQSGFVKVPAIPRPAYRQTGPSKETIPSAATADRGRSILSGTTIVRARVISRHFSAIALFFPAAIG